MDASLPEGELKEHLRPGGFSGRNFTILFVVLLILGVIAGFLAAIRFQKTMAAFDDVRLRWSAAASDIEDQLHAIESKLASESNELNQPARDAWQQDVRAFQDYSQYEKQVIALVPVINSTRSLVSQFPTIGIHQFPETSKPIQAFIEADKKLEELQSDWLGRVSHSLFGLNLSKRVFQQLL